MCHTHTHHGKNRHPTKYVLSSFCAPLFMCGGTLLAHPRAQSQLHIPCSSHTKTFVSTFRDHKYLKRGQQGWIHIIFITSTENAFLTNGDPHFLLSACSPFSHTMLCIFRPQA